MYTEVKDAEGRITAIQTDEPARDILDNPLINKGTAFNAEERKALGLYGHLPTRVESMQSQVQRVYRQFQSKNCPIEKNIFLNTLHDSNTTLFYKFCSQHVDEVLPIVYTPTVGDAVEAYSTDFRRPSGVYLSYNNREYMDEVLSSFTTRQIDFIIVTDGEAVLGIGDWGVGGMDISIGKLMVYIICAGINPARVLPIQLDVGTNNPKLLDDPLYLGSQHKRVDGEEYDAYIEQFVKCVEKNFPNVYLHWEDFGRGHARSILEKYRPQLCTFNDDMQGTGIVATANVIAAIEATKTQFRDHRVVMFGAGTAGCGIMDQILDAFVDSGMSREEALERFYIIDRNGLIVDDMEDLPDFQKKFARNRGELADWEVSDTANITLTEVVANSGATILIGCSTVKGAFTNEILRQMGKNTRFPVIMPLSNPTANSEAEPKDVIEQTEGRAIMAAGSPFDPVEYQGKTYQISQGNNAFIFPGLGLGAIAVKATAVSDGMIRAASQTLSSFSPLHDSPDNPVLPPIHDAPKVSKAVAIAVGQQAVKEGLSSMKAEVDDVEKLVELAQWQPNYIPVRR
ncbi:NAD-dependent malic enzyme [Puniceicoccus vermicola]|uniref:NAD-dependent malic enzyme n=1 Tax=Puniceicoccus vermicola TaxID=388746 RepID=A0A7X1E2B8_9BACT|nr:NAD-dependent malic enzyme [Puniceicoccus vermicola]MBC2600290.1 NAD-dependent malic enzyme [Puniceicoccus vermicola]